jgi:hypothetical protein
VLTSTTLTFNSVLKSAGFLLDLKSGHFKDSFTSNVLASPSMVKVIGSLFTLIQTGMFFLNFPFFFGVYFIRTIIVLSGKISFFENLTSTPYGSSILRRYAFSVPALVNVKSKYFLSSLFSSPKS